MDDAREDRLLVLSTFVGRAADEDAWIRDNLPRVADWAAFVDAVIDNRVGPRVHAQLGALGLLAQVPGPERQRLAADAARIAAVNATRLDAGAPVLEALRDRGVEVVVLKGVALAETLYGDPGYKRMNDIDLLIHKEDLATVYDVYRAHGLFPVAERVGRDLDRQVVVSHHAPPFVNRAVTLMLGTQWAFKSPMLKLGFDYAAVWRRTEPFTLRGVPLRRLGWEDQLHHLCVHLDRFKAGARDLMDIYNLAHARGPTLDWGLLAREIRAAGTEDYVAYALGLAVAYRPNPDVEALLREIAPRVHPRIKALTAWRSRSTRVLLRSCSRQMSAIEKAVTEFNATDRLREKLPRFVRGWLSILAPPIDEALRICALPDATAGERLRARLGAPLALIRAIRDEIGGLLLLGLAVKSSLDLLRSAVPLGERRGLQGYADSLGVSLDELRAIQEAVE